MVIYIYILYKLTLDYIGSKLGHTNINLSISYIFYELNCTLLLTMFSVVKYIACSLYIEIDKYYSARIYEC